MIFAIFHWKFYILVKYNPIRIPIFPEKRDPRPGLCTWLRQMYVFVVLAYITNINGIILYMT